MKCSLFNLDARASKRETGCKGCQGQDAVGNSSLRPQGCRKCRKALEKGANYD